MNYISSLSSDINNSNDRIYDNYQQYSKYVIVLLVFYSTFWQVTSSANTVPLTWNYHPTLIQCGKKTIASPSNTTIPTFPGLNYTITFNRLTNPTKQYYPALGFVDISYIYTYYQSMYFSTNSFIPTSTDFIVNVQTVDSSAKLTRYSINYLAVSNDFTDFFIYIDYTGLSINRQVDASNPYIYTRTLSTPLKTTSNINTIVSITQMNFNITESSPFWLDLQVTTLILDNQNYNWTVQSHYASNFVNFFVFYVIFYQQVTIFQTVLIPIQYSWNSVHSSVQQIVYPSNLTDSFEVNQDNSFFGFYRMCTNLLTVDFTITYTSAFSMQLAFNQTRIIKGSIFIFRQPVCPPFYILYKNEPICVCNNIYCYEGVGCSSVIAVGAIPKCQFCSIIDNFVVVSNGSCVCKTGYQLNNETCELICGDGIKINDQCDDGNNINGDGCSSVCTIQNGFQCHQILNGTSVCLFKQNICFNLTTIQKSYDNSAIFIFQAIGNSFALILPINAFTVKKTLNLTIKRNDSTNCDINYSISKIYDQTVQVLVNFQQTIEGLKAIAEFNFNNTSYQSQNCTLNFVCQGSGMPMNASKYTKQYDLIANINLAFVCLLTILFIFSIFAPKWIGIEVMQVNQLIFFSQLLITDASNWPVAFQVFKYLKYTNGFNNIFSNRAVQTFSNSSKKWSFLDFEPAFILNFSVNFIFILFFYILYFLLNPSKKKRQKQHQQQSDQKKDKIKKFKQLDWNERKSQRRLYSLLINVAIWSLLQFLASIISQFQLLIYPFNKYDFVIPLQVNNLFMNVSLFAFIFIGFNIFTKCTLSEQALKIFELKPQLQTYKKVNMGYHFIIGASMFCFNSFSYEGVPISILFFIAEVVYIVYTFKLRPYKQCIWIHSIGFIFNRFGYLIFLGFITLKNLIVNINEIIMLAMCYFLIVFIIITILLSIVRLYYDLRLGEEYEKKMEDIRKQKQLEEHSKNLYILERKKQQQQYELQEIRQEARQKQLKTGSLQTKDKNKYRIQRIILQEKQVELLQFLQKKNWTKIQKEKYYYQKYAQKPLIWLQKHDKKQYQIRMKEIIQQRERNKSKQTKKISKKDEKDKEQLEIFKRERRLQLKTKEEYNNNKNQKTRKK